MDVLKIVKLDELLRDYLGNEKIITNHETTNLTAMGENYGSSMLAVKIYVNNEQSEVINAVAKLPPPSEFLQKAFNIPVTFRNEYHFYKYVIPAMKAFLRQKNIHDFLDCFPGFMGGRLSFQADNSAFADTDAAIILENLKLSRFVSVERSVGYNLDAARLILRALAKFHAIPIALKYHDHDSFHELVKPISTPYKVFDFDSDMFNSIIEKNRKMIEGIESCKHLADRLVAAFKTYPPVSKNAPEFIREPWATVIHTDAWVNNFMVCFEDSGKPESCKIVDFQLVEYGSPARDVIFFLFTSVQIHVLQNHYDELIDFYYKNLIADLGLMGCDSAQFPRQEFENEIVLSAKEFEFMHCIIMLQPLYATTDTLKNLDEYNEDDLTEDREVSQGHKERAAFIVKEFAKRKWI